MIGKDLGCKPGVVEGAESEYCSSCVAFSKRLKKMTESIRLNITMIWYIVLCISDYNTRLASTINKKMKLHRRMQKTYQREYSGGKNVILRSFF